MTSTILLRDRIDAGTYADQARMRDALVAQAALSEADRSAIWQNQTGPDQKEAVLADDDVAVVFAEEPRALRDQEVAAGGTVKDVGGDLRGDLARQVGAEPGDERGRNDGAGLEDEGTGWGYQPFWASWVGICAMCQKRLLTCYSALRRGGALRRRKHG